MTAMDEHRTFRLVSIKKAPDGSVERPLVAHVKLEASTDKAMRFVCGPVGQWFPRAALTEWKVEDIGGPPTYKLKSGFLRDAIALFMQYADKRHQEGKIP